MGSLFNPPRTPQPQIIQPPAPPEPVVMPIADPEAQKRQESKRLAAARAKTTTRASTILGNDGDFLG